MGLYGFFPILGSSSPTGLGTYTYMHSPTSEGATVSVGK